MNRKIFIYLFILNFFCTFVKAQNASGSATLSYATHQLESVTFHQPEDIPNNWIRFFKDPTPNIDPNVVVNPLDYVSPYVDKTVAYTTTDQQPVAYASGCTGVVSAEFTSNCEGRSFYVKGEGIEGFNLKPQLVKVVNGKFTYPKTEFSGPIFPSINRKFENLKVRHFPNFTIKWSISDKTTGTYKQIGKSNNPLYVTHKKPINTYVIHSFLFISCKSADNKNIEDDVMSTIYDDFTDQCVKKYNGSKCMGYWVEPKPPQGGTAVGLCFTGIALIAWENATCGAWADLHVELVKAQGLNYIELVGVSWTDNTQLAFNSQEFLDLETDVVAFFGNLSPNLSAVGSSNLGLRADFYVNNYNFPDGFHSFYLNEKEVIPSFILPNGKILKSINQQGVKGQNNPDPRSHFENHAITKNIKNSKYYDPSYGTALVNDATQWKNGNIAGFGTRLKYIHILPSGQITEYQVSWVGYSTTQKTILFNK